MNDPNVNQPNDPRPERIREALNETAVGLDLRPIEPADVVSRAAGRQRRRRVALVGGTTVAAVAIVGAIVANGDPAEFATTGPTSAPTTMPESSLDAPADSTVPTTAPITTPATLPPLIEESDEATAIEVSTTATEAPANGFEQLLPWKDGFLAIGYEYTSQPLGPIPEEIAALFPDEVVDLFPDGLPPTIDEAAAILSEAGLLDEVTEVLNNHQEATDAVYALDPPPPALTASFTTDGDTWRAVTIENPPMTPGQFSISGSSLVAWSTEFWDVDTPQNGGPQSLTLARTSDLVSWEMTTVDIPVPQAPNAHTVSQSYVNSVAVVGDRWLARVDTDSWVDHMLLLPADLRTSLEADEFGFGIGTTDDGITVERGRGDGQPPEIITYTWSELGLDGDPGREAVREPEAILLVGSFDGSAEEVAMPEAGHYGQVLALEDGFLLVGAQSFQSLDGLTWSPIDGIPADANVTSMIPIGDSQLLIGDGPTGQQAWRRDALGRLSDVTLPSLPERYSLWNTNGTPAWIVELGSVEPPDWEPITVVIEYAGFVLTMIDGEGESSYSLVDASSGELVRDSSADPQDDTDGIWVFDDETATSSIVIRDDAGDPIVSIPDSAAQPAFEAAYEAQAPPAEQFNEWEPDLWLIATLDGVNWVTIDLEDPDPEQGPWPSAAAVNDGAVLYQTVDGWDLALLTPGS